MSDQRQTPEQVICAMSCDELRELLSELKMEATVDAAIKLKRLVGQLGRFEDAIEAFGGPPSMNDAA